jgi:hypothetical protein
MAASSGPREASRKPGEIQAHAIGQVKINKGTFVFARAADGLSYPGRSVANITDVFQGVAFETRDNSAGAAGALSCRVEKEGAYVFAKANAVQTDVGLVAYALDDQTVTTAQSANVVPVGYIQEVIDSANVRVRINRAVQ